VTRGTCELILQLETESAVWAEKTSETKASEMYFWNVREAPSFGWFPKSRRIHVRIKLRNTVDHLNLCQQNIRYDSRTNTELTVCNSTATDPVVVNFRDDHTRTA
jgi:hypothetical protein